MPLKINRPSKQEQIFAWIVAYKRSHDGNSPTLRELMSGCDLSSLSVTYDCLRRLTAVGLIDRQASPGTRGRSRQIVIVGGRWSYSPTSTSGKRAAR
jgi:hypothetical protein